MVVPAKRMELAVNSKIKSKIGWQKVTVTPNIIASTMGYERPLEG